VCPASHCITLRRASPREMLPVICVLGPGPRIALQFPLFGFTATNCHFIHVTPTPDRLAFTCRFSITTRQVVCILHSVPCVTLSPASCVLRPAPPAP
jgi:hypothetical protein